MNEKHPIYSVPVPSTEFTTVAFWDDTDSAVRYAYREHGLVREAGIRFQFAAAIRMRAERSCTEWHITDAYDTLVEVDDSDWMREIYEDMDKNWRDRWKMRHFMIYLDSAGCFEVVADSWEAF